MSEMSESLRSGSPHVSFHGGVRKALLTGLNATLAAAIDLTYQLKQAHWNVRGAQFFTRHQLFDELAEHAVDWSDQVAERIGALGCYAGGTVRLAAAGSPLEEHDLSAVLGDAHVASLVRRYAMFAAFLRKRVEEARVANDSATEALYTGILRALELDLWLLESHMEPSLGHPGTPPPVTSESTLCRSPISSSPPPYGPPLP